MYVQRLTGPAESQILEPTWAQVDEAIRALNGQDKSMVMLDAGLEVPHMCIGGGDGRYIAYVTYDNLVFFNLTDPSLDDSMCSLIAGGQRGDYPGRQCVDLPLVLRAAQTFAKSGKHEPSLRWTRDG
jgi:hypothetical protein